MQIPFWTLIKHTSTKNTTHNLRKYCPYDTFLHSIFLCGYRSLLYYMVTITNEALHNIAIFLASQDGDTNETTTQQYCVTTKHILTPFAFSKIPTSTTE